MNKIFIGIGVTIIAIVTILVLKSPAQAPTPSSLPQVLAEQTKQVGDVTIKVTPLDIGASVWQFKVVFDAHAGDLNQDLVLDSYLATDGAERSALRWQGDPPGGHHRQGVLEFEPINPQASSIRLRIGGFEGGNVVFNWEL